MSQSYRLLHKVLRQDIREEAIAAWAATEGEVKPGILSSTLNVRSALP